MTPTYQKVILWVLLISSVAIAAYLIRLRTQTQEQMGARPAANPVSAPVEAPSTQVTLMLANDDDGSLSAVHRKLALPADESMRAKTLLNDLFAEYAQPHSSHPLTALPAVRDVFLVPLPGSKDDGTVNSGGKQMAVVNLDGTFVAHHPSGILVETLTLVSILATLRANLPRIADVRFLVDGQVKQTLAGHVDLTETYLTANDIPQSVPPGATGAVSKSAAPLKAGGEKR